MIIAKNQSYRSAKKRGLFGSKNLSERALCDAEVFPRLSFFLRTVWCLDGWLAGCAPLAAAGGSSATAIMPGKDGRTDHDDDVGSIFFCCFLNAAIADLLPSGSGNGESASASSTPPS